MKLLSREHPADHPHYHSKLATGLGWFSIGLGLAQLVAPRALSRLIGVPNRPWIFALLGLRELASGFGILRHDKTTNWLWTRVGGDMIDLGLLGTALARDEGEARKIEAAAAAVLGVTVLDVIAASQCSDTTCVPGTIHFCKTITIDRSPSVVYKFWRSFENLPRFMRNLESVTTIGNRSHWVAKGPAGQRVEWDAELLEDIPGHLISWRALEGSQVDNSGAVRFDPSPDGIGTLVRVDITYRPPAGMLGAAFARIFGKAPDQEVQGDLARFKDMLETGSPAHAAAPPEHTSDGPLPGSVSNP